MKEGKVYFGYSERSIGYNPLHVGDTCHVPVGDSIYIKVAAEDCSGYSHSDITAYPDWQPIEFEIDEEIRENGFGQTEITKKRVVRWHSFRINVDEKNRRELYEMVYSTHNLHIINTQSVQHKPPISIITEEMTISGDEPLSDTGVFMLTLRFKVKENKVQTETDGMGDFGVGACCEALYTEAPYEDDCNQGGGEDCDNSYSLTYDDGQDKIIASGTGATSGRFKFYLDGSLIADGSQSSVAFAGYGTYRVVVQEDGCIYEAVLTVPDPCAGLSVRIEHTGGGAMIAHTTGGGGLTYNWQEYDDGNDSWSDAGEASSSFQAPDFGTYRVVVTNADGCEVSDIVHYSDDSCDWTISISEDNGVIEVTESDSGNYTYSWEIDKGDGQGFKPLSGSTQFQNLVASGTYRVTVVDDNGCTQQAIYTYINCGSDCDNTTVLITELGGQLNVTLNPQPVQVQYFWYLFEEGDDGFISIGAGNSVNITVNGVYKVKAIWDNCVKEAIYLVNR